MCRFIRHKAVSSIFLSTATIYFLLFEIFRNEWGVFLSHSEISRQLFFVLAAFSFLTVALTGIGDWVDEMHSKSRAGFRDDLIALASKLVRAKLERFKSAASRINSRDNVFKKITHPSDQINILLAEFSKLLQERFSLQEDQICITIMQIDETQEKPKAYYKFTTHNDWQHTKAKEILEADSAAKKCLNTGEPVFFHDKQRAYKNGSYFLSERDKRKGNGKGSVYCHPSFTETPNYKVKYVISIVTYGKCIGYVGDLEEKDAIKVIFNEICRRIDLELTLKSIKDWKS